MISVLIATFNGADTLPRTLDALARLQVPSDGWRVIVVDNGSTDATPGSAPRSWLGRLPLLLLHQPRRGKSRALNLGLDHCDGDLVVFTDDDVIPSPGWLLAYRAAADTHPDVDVFNGPTKPYWSVVPPDYILRNVPVGATYGLSDPFLVEGPVRWDLVWGANMAVRGYVARSGCRFNADLGPQGRRYRCGEDNDYVMLLDRFGHRMWHVPAAAVAHIIDDHQATRAWLMRRALALGRALYHERTVQHPAGILPFAVRGLARQTIRMGYAAVRRKSSADVFAAQWNFAILLGHVLEALDLRI